VLSADYPPFRPLSLMRSAHLQTVGAYLLRGHQSEYKAAKHVVPLEDGDRLVIHDDKPASWITGDRIAILFHGLCGCHLSPYMVRAADKLRRQGVRTFRIDMRGFGDSTLISKSHLHGGRHQDVISIVDFVHRLSPISKISLVGYSIGGNIILKTLGIWGDQSHQYVDSAIAVSPPVDLVYCSWNLRQRGNRFYESYFVSRLKSQLTKRRRLVKDLVDNQVTPLPTRLVHWDDQFTAPCWGYRGAREYYQDASSGPVLDRVRVPTIILSAQDDPVVPFDMFDNFSRSDQIELISPKQGGHLGFIGQGLRDPDRYWMDWRICQWVTSLDNGFESEIRQVPGSRIQRRSGSTSSRT
jgi:predicted alpha/beta-fold hydrolase